MVYTYSTKWKIIIAKLLYYNLISMKPIYNKINNANTKLVNKLIKLMYLFF